MGETGILLSILGALAVGGLAYAATRPAATPAAPATGGSSCTTGALPAGYSWQLATQLVHGDHVRVSMTPATFNTVASSLGLSGGGIAGWTNLLAQPQVAAVLGTANICAWAPGDALPVDWPADDIDEATEYHAEFVYQGQVALPTSSLPLPLSVWRAVAPIKGTSSPGATTQGNVGKGASSYNPSTAPQTVHLDASMGTGNVLQVADTLVGTPITFTIDGGGTFSTANAWVDVYDAAGINVVSTKPAIGYPKTIAGASVWTFDTTSESGGVLLLWTDLNGTAHQTTIKYA